MMSGHIAGLVNGLFWFEGYWVFVALISFNGRLRKQYLESLTTVLGLVLSQTFNYLPVF